MKHIFLVFVFLFLMAFPVMANEGVVNLRGVGNSVCFASSIYIDGNYKIMMTCRGLLTAVSPENNRYVAWVEDTEGKIKRLGEIVNGKLSTIAQDKFARIFVTTEYDSYGNKPSADVVLNGSISPIDFGKNVPTVAVITTAPSPSPTVTPTPSKTTTTTKTTTTSTSQSSLSSALSTIFKIALFGFGLLLLVVGIFSFLQRRRSL